ncbi:glucose 1-dehydrogenase [Zhongshania marina]|uniref:Glucose 1-dehydrogenase n=1 Tax=Zhongshania marina TaxID=2304603 RepID=A0ABX9W5S2_9GAMM|nr:glucose 1-dehydrogenase [Zhongshania marina]
MGRVEGKVAIVTGAAQGLGEAFARRLVEEGAKVVMTDIDEVKGYAAAKEIGDSALFLKHDVSNESQWIKIVNDAEAIFGSVSILINNAGVVTYSPIEMLEMTDFQNVININQIGVMLGMKIVFPSMKRAGGGAIINISSSAGLIGSPGLLAYVATKFAVRGMTKTAAIEFAPFNIRVNSIHPGMFDTRLSSPTPESAETLKSHLAHTLTGRLGETVELANVVLMLASDEVRFATGAEFVIDGGDTCQ